MNYFKPKMCSWLHVAWLTMKEMKSMIMKGWVKIGITRTFMTQFQFVASKANTIIS
jgi:hypothetical protein